jgi:hypothetical protein
VQAKWIHPLWRYKWPPSVTSGNTSTFHQARLCSSSRKSSSF